MPLWAEALEWDEDIVSETLADLLARHRHLDKAKTMYKKLALKYPQKSAYFAAKIEKLPKGKDNS